MATLDESYAKALDLLAGHRAGAAEEVLLSSLSTRPRAAQSIYLLGLSLLVQRRWALARRVLEHAYAVKPWLRDLSSDVIDLGDLAREAVVVDPDWDWPRYELERRAFFSIGLSLGVVVEKHLRHAEVRFLEVGANDGRDHDPVHQFVVEHEWTGLAVEPVPETFDALCRTYADLPRVRCIQAAVSEQDGTVTIFRAANSKLASLVPDRNALRSGTTDSVVVPSIRMATLLQRYDFDRFDLLQIDTEGYDYHVLAQCDLGAARPLCINMEFYCLPLSERLATFELLRRHQFAYRFDGMDLIAIDRSRASADFCIDDVTRGAHLRSVTRA